MIRLLPYTVFSSDTRRLWEIPASIRNSVYAQARRRFGRTNTVEEMARAVMFLASDEATAFYGLLVDVTGGNAGNSRASWLCSVCGSADVLLTTRAGY